MLIENNIRGAWVISEIINEHLETRTYYGYSKREAVEEFINEFAHELNVEHFLEEEV